MRKTVVCLILVLLSTVLWGQKCKKYHKRNCFSYGYPFSYSAQSKDFDLVSQQTLEFDIMVMGGYEYNVSLAFDDLLGDVVFKIANKTKSIVYYSSEDAIENKYDKQFVVDETKKLMIIIIVPDSKIRNVKYGSPRCAGLLVEYNKQPNLGF